MLILYSYLVMRLENIIITRGKNPAQLSTSPELPHKVSAGGEMQPGAIQGPAVEELRHGAV